MHDDAIGYELRSKSFKQVINEAIHLIDNTTYRTALQRLNTHLKFNRILAHEHDEIQKFIQFLSNREDGLTGEEETYDMISDTCDNFRPAILFKAKAGYQLPLLTVDEVEAILMASFDHIIQEKQPGYCRRRAEIRNLLSYEETRRQLNRHKSAKEIKAKYHMSGEKVATSSEPTESDSDQEPINFLSEGIHYYPLLFKRDQLRTEFKRSQSTSRLRRYRYEDSSTAGASSSSTTIAYDSTQIQDKGKRKDPVEAEANPHRGKARFNY